MLASLPADMVNQKLADLGIPNRFSLTSSRSSGATSLGPVFDAGLTRRPGALLKWHWPLSARTFATSLPFASMFPCWQGREWFAPSIRIRWRGSKIARACALNVSGAWPLPLTPVPWGKFR